ncbi:MAG: hypothetical protein LUE17_03510 [Planctomycetaceae bacterium]|nr:hypothetical protein [Planctomycetaceae bacterium]
MRQRLPIPRRPTREPEGEEELYTTYGRPSVSAWVAAAAVAFAFFLLGGFIKTYRQLESLREESRREIAELRESVRRLQTVQPPPPAVSRSQPRFTPLAQAAGRRETDNPGFSQSLQPTPSSSMMSAASAASSLRPAGRETPRLLEEAMLSEYGDGQERPRYQVGRRGSGDNGQLLSATGGPAQVVSVSTAHKRIMVEGGRDLSLGEGERLELVRDGRWIADLRVVDVFDYQSSCEVLHATIAPIPGDTVRRPPQSR